MKTPLTIIFNEAHVNEMEQAGYFGDIPSEIATIRAAWLKTMQTQFTFGKPANAAEFDEESERIMEILLAAFVRNISLDVALGGYPVARRYTQIA